MSDDWWKECDPRLQLALAQTEKALDLQREHLSELRSRTAGALTLSTVAFAFVQGSVSGASSSSWSWVSAGAIGILFVLTLFGAWPRPWNFAVEPNSFEWFWINQRSMDQMTSKLFDDRRKDYAANTTRLRWIEQANRAALVTLGVVIASLVLAIWRAR